MNKCSVGRHAVLSVSASAPLRIRWSTLVAAILVVFAIMGAPEPANSGSGFGHFTDAYACFNPDGKTADEQIAACATALNSHTLDRHNVALALNNLAVGYERKHDWDSALNALSAALKLGSNTWQALVNRSQLYAKVGKTELALADLNRSIDLHCPKSVCLRARGRIYMDQQKYDLATADLTQALALDPSDVRSLLLRSECLQLQGDAAEAAADLARAKQLDPTSATSPPPERKTAAP